VLQKLPVPSGPGGFTVPTQPEDSLAASRSTSLERPIERRQNRRYPAQASVAIEVRKGTMGLGPNLALHLLDLSVDGAGVLMKNELQEKDEVEIILSGHGVGPNIKRIARVHWVTKLESDHFVIGFSFEKQIPFIDVRKFVRPG
jgi:c-di-GMP-binding flagellar brake protein YcgR